MPAKGTRKSKGGSQETAGKRTRNLRALKKGQQSGSQTNQPFEQDAKRRIGQFVGAGEPPLIKK